MAAPSSSSSSGPVIDYGRSGYNVVRGGGGSGDGDNSEDKR